MTTAAGRFRRLLAAAMVAAGTCLMVFPTLASAQDPRTDTDLLGYDIEARSAPLSVRFFEDFIPIPVDPGDPQFELTGSHSATTLTTGPLSRAVASTVWPGGGVGDGFGALTCAFDPNPEECDDSTEYPVRASAEYPGSGPDSWSAQNGDADAGIGMFADALGLDNVARSETTHLPGLEALIEVGSVRSQSESRVKDGLAFSTTVAEISEISIAGGVLVLEGVTTTLESVSDGENASTTGETVIGGIEVAGMPAKITDEGLVVTPPEEDDGDDEEDPVGELLGGVTDPLSDLLTSLTADLLGQGVRDALGVSVEALEHVETIEGAIAERSASGVVITLETAVLNDYLQPLLGAVGFNELLGLLPEEANDLRGYLQEIANFAPKIEFVLGQAFVAASASPPFVLPEIEPPPPADPVTPPAPPPPPETSTGGNTGQSTPPSSGLSLPPSTSGGGPITPPTSVAPPASTPNPPVAAVAALPAPYDGIPAVVVGLAFLLAAVPTWGLRTLRETAVGASAAVAPEPTLPDLRGGA